MRSQELISVSLCLSLLVTRVQLSQSVARPGVGLGPTAGTDSALENIGCEPQMRSMGVELTPTREHYEIGENVSYACAHDTLYLVGAVTSSCSVNGTWSGAPPSCLGVTCDNATLENGYISEVYNLTAYERVTYTCHEGFELVGHNTRHCLHNATGYQYTPSVWDNELPQCIRTCGDAFTPNNGYVSTNCTYENCTAVFSCNEGFTLHGDTAASCSSSAWEHTIAVPNCTVITCETPSTVEHAHRTFEPEVTDDRYPYDTVVKYVCSENYSMSGEEELYCSRAGEWQGQLPVCVDNTTDRQCAALNVSHGRTQKIGDLGLYTCDYGYRLIGPRQRLCLQNGTWTETDPICVLEKPCGEPEKVNFANRTIEPPTAAETHHYGYHTQVTYVCMQNASMTSVMTCNENGAWMGVELLCKDPRIDSSPDMSGGLWKEVFIAHPHWVGSYRYWDQSVRFQLFVISDQDTHSDGLLLLFDDYEAKLYLKVSYRDKTFTFHKSRVFTYSERFLPHHNWSFTGHMLKEDNQWRFFSSHFHQSKFKQLQMSPVHGTGRVPTLAELEGDDKHKNATALALGMVLATILVLVAAGLAAYFMKQHVFKPGGHRVITSFENPVYDCDNVLRDNETNEIQHQVLTS